MKFQDRYNSLTNFQKIELFSIPILIFVFLYLNDFFIANDLASAKSVQKIETPHACTNQKSHLDMVQNFETLAKTHHIKICALSIQSIDEIDMKSTGKINDLLNYLHKIEQSYQIDRLEFQCNENLISISLLLCQKRYQDDQSPLQKIAITDPFEKMITKVNLPSEIKSVISQKIQKTQIKTLRDKRVEKETIEVQNLEINTTIDLNETSVALEEEDMIEIFPHAKTAAIVGKYVLLNKNWLTIGDRYKGYTIVSITNEMIKFQNGNKEAIMEMFGND